MKKALMILLSLCLAASLFGCVQPPEAPAPTEPEAPKNQIAPMELSAEQKKIVNLLSPMREILLLEYEISESYQTATFWIDRYEHGELTDTIARLPSKFDNGQIDSGTIAVVITGAADTMLWSLSHAYGSRTSTVATNEQDGANSLNGRPNPLRAPLSIEADKELVLGAFLYTPSDVAAPLLKDQQRYLEEPEWLEACPYAYLIKCKFE